MEVALSFPQQAESGLLAIRLFIYVSIMSESPPLGEAAALIKGATNETDSAHKGKPKSKFSSGITMHPNRVSGGGTQRRKRLIGRSVWNGKDAPDKIPILQRMRRLSQLQHEALD